MLKYITILIFVLSLLSVKAAEVDEAILNNITSSVEISYIQIDYTEISYLDASKNWDEIKFIASPTVNYLQAYYDCFGLTKTYYPEIMSYYGHKWIELKERESKEGFNSEISAAWVKLLKELKPYIK